ncbi:MAG: thioredoxin-like domain-containing protein [Bacteroidetes bacterium]|nr:thioredoxin-like domain-containing protein [Bacteroidota bacterium]
MALSASRTFKPIIELQGIKKGETTTLPVSKEYLPGEFVLRFDYKETESGTPYPSEKTIFLNEQNIQLRVNPEYCNNPDSTRFQDGERENATFAQFSNENSRKKEKLGLLQNFLMNYDDVESSFYRQGIKEYEVRRSDYNQWLAERIMQDQSLFVSNLYGFQYVPEIPWKGTETDRDNYLIAHYFDGMDFNNPLIIKTSNLNKWMDNYINLYGRLATTAHLRDSLLPAAGRNAIEIARKGNPLVYGWMVDYFYRGYETNGIDAGIKMLESYLKDTNCMTSKRVEIARRIKGIETLVAGIKAPDISLKDAEGNLFELNKFETQSRYILLLFWSAGCSHCVEMTDNLYPWQHRPEIQQKLMVIAISLDETETEVKAWKEKIREMTGWKHMRAADGVRSKAASDYFVLATPVMVLLDAKTKEIISTPNTVKELIAAIH